jgi:hypothetical protein
MKIVLADRASQTGAIQVEFRQPEYLDLRKLFLQSRQELLRIADFSSGKNEFAN